MKLLFHKPHALSYFPQMAPSHALLSSGPVPALTFSPYVSFGYIEILEAFLGNCPHASKIKPESDPFFILCSLALALFTLMLIIFLQIMSGAL